MSKWKQNNQQANWKWPLLLGIIALLTLMFVIPTIIVIPFKSDQMIQASIETVNNDTPAKEEIAALESPFDVGVLRTAKNEVEQIPLEEYVAHVIASEMPADFEMEALKAQALAARTFIIKFLMQENTDKLPGDADVKDTVEHQVYKSTDELRQIWGAVITIGKWIKLWEQLQLPKDKL
ncbi:stage II sporulation protein D [Gracilibacillus boraciitolerans JCM 21714]|uniref:Stage II sporulation protein D n=1 Tax=Gracilibacillus boraciitolerans JCM 21714 TaxID=1298598 RepID=W4VIB9_9BACI|nr:stage II sporulation protein D [Gracilibacillus boraciitolerans JCM 21714]